MLRPRQLAPRYEDQAETAFTGQDRETAAREMQRLTSHLSRHTGVDATETTLLALRFASANRRAFARFSQPRRTSWRDWRLRPRMSIETFTTLLFLLGVLASAILVLTGG